MIWTRKYGKDRLRDGRQLRGGIINCRRYTNTFFFFWARHVTSILKREKLRLSSIIDELESLAEVRLVYTHEIELKSQSNAQIVDLLGERELKWYQ
jgi:hypothetical protein